MLFEIQNQESQDTLNSKAPKSIEDTPCKPNVLFANFHGNKIAYDR